MEPTRYTAFYENITGWIRRRQHGVFFLNLINHIVTGLMYLLYPLLLLRILLSGFCRRQIPGSGMKELLLYLLVPGISFVLLSIIRDRLNRKRPYEEHPIHPLIRKNTSGHSMPSRHVFSCTIIAMCFLAQSVPFGVFLLCLSLLLAVVRVLGGVHYPKDTAAGMLCGLAAGGLLLFLLSLV